MNAMETMALSVLTKMTGLTPEAMQEMAHNALTTIAAIDTRLKNIEDILARIEPVLPAKVEPFIETGETALHTATVIGDEVTGAIQPHELTYIPDEHTGA